MAKPAAHSSRIRRFFERAARDDARLASYQLVELLEVGGMGEVWRAQHPDHPRPVALKLIRPERRRDAAARERFRMEARVTSTLESAHTVRVLDSGVSADGVFYYAMELLVGIDLDEAVASFGAMPHQRVIHILLQACDALADAHRKGVIHRDVKPSNIFLSRDDGRYDFVKLVDFGLVRAVGCDRDEMSTPRSVTGTPAFLPPEVAMAECIGECEVDGRADLYSLAAVAYFLLSTRTLFDKPSAIEMAAAHAVEKPVSLGDVAAVPVPEPLEHIIMACLAKDPAQRPPTAEALAERLRSIGGARWTNDDARQWWRQHLTELA